MGGFGYRPTGAATRTYKKGIGVFKNLRKKARKIAEEEAQDMAVDMHFILKFRFPLKGGNGRWPKFDPVQKSLKSYSKWNLESRSNGEYWLYNTATRGGDNFNYPKIVIRGVGWNMKPENAPFPRLVPGPNGKWFSSQMPNGLDPWIKIKRKDFAHNLGRRFKDEFKGN
jgi:hypothetical protein